MNHLIIKEINNFIGSKNIIKRKILSNSFGIICERISLDNLTSFVVKYYNKNNYYFNAIKSEGDTLNYINKKFPNLFPSVKLLNKELLVMDDIEHNNVKNIDYQKILAEKVAKIHSINHQEFGFFFDTQIGGLKQPCGFNDNWISFFCDKRLGMIFEEINKSNLMPSNINRDIEKLLNNIENFIPKNPNISLLHGDLWEGNILFNNGDLVGLIDPGLYFGHNELEISYLTWFNYVDSQFLDHYSNIITIDRNYFSYEPIYQLYFCLLNVHLWSRNYIKNAKELLKKIFN